MFDRFKLTLILFLLMAIGTVNDASAIGRTGWYATRLKMEYQYSDYDDYVYPLIESDDPLRGWEYINPYITDFPEHRLLTKVIQAIGPMNSIEARHEYSDLNEYKDQNRYLFRYDRSLTDLTVLYGSCQFLNVSNNVPDSSSNSGGYSLSLGVKHDRSGWIKSEAALSLDRMKIPDGTTIRTILPMLKLRWSLNRLTALSGRWDGYITESDTVSSRAHAFTGMLSRYLPTKTALHLYTRYYINNYGIKSFSPAVEVAQYLRWNLIAKLNYRYYSNRYKKSIEPVFIPGGEVLARSIRAGLDWQASTVLKVNLSYRRYISDLDVSMNTYLVSLEYEL